MKASEFFGGKFTSAADIGNTTAALKINAITSEVLEDRDGKERERIILHIDGIEKPVVVNATNAAVLIDAWGDETDAWIGKSVCLSRTKILFRGTRVYSVKITPVTKGSGE